MAPLEQSHDCLGHPDVIDVVALTSGLHVPSTRFRVRQQIPALHASGVRVREAIPRVGAQSTNPLSGTVVPDRVSKATWAAARISARAPGLIRALQADVTWLSRALVPGHPTVERLLARPLVYDIDDAVWLRPPAGERQVMQTARRSAIVLAGNEFIADHIASSAADVRIVPTAIDTDRFLPRHPRSDRPVVGWTGTSSNFVYLEPVVESITPILDRHDAELLVVADREPRFVGAPPKNFTFCRWDPSREADVVSRMDVGLMPLDGSDWSRGKCAFKLLQYMASGAAFVATPVGMNRSLIGDGAGLAASSGPDWAETVDELLKNESARVALAARGRSLAEGRYSIHAVAPTIAVALKDAAGVA